MNNGKHIGVTSDVKRQLREAVAQHGHVVVAVQIGVAPKTVGNYLDGTTKKWRSGTRDKIVALTSWVPKVAATVHAPPKSTLRRLYAVLKADGTSTEVLGTVARFILENE